MKRGIDLTKGKETKVILKFGLPMLFGNIVQQLYNVIDAAIVGKFVGKVALSAVGVGFPILFLLSSITIGFVIGGTILISQFFGAKKLDEVQKIIDTMILVMVVASIFITFFGIAFSHSIFRLLNFPEENIDLAVLYFKIVMSGNIAFFGYNVINAILRGVGDSRTPVYLILGSGILNVIGDIVLIVIFDMGVKGAGIATVGSVAMALIGGIVYINSKHKILKIRLKLTFDKVLFRKILKISLPSSAHMFIVSFGMILSFSIINLFGTDVIAAYTVVGRVNSFALMPAMFFSNALSVFVGQNYGANQMRRIVTGLKSTVWLIIASSFAFSFVFLLFPEAIIKLFINANEQNVIKIGLDYFYRVAPFYLLFGIMFVFNAVYKGVGNTATPMYITLISLWIVRFPVMILLAMKIQFSPFALLPVKSEALWWGEPIGWAVGMLVALWYYFSKRWIKKRARFVV